jgi:inorganic pyrophosphatase
MSIRKYLETQPLHELIKYDPDPEIRKNALAFIGALRKHPYDADKLLLITDPFSSDTEFYEFMIADVVCYEEQPGIATDSGENLFMVKIWVQKGSFGIQYHPFEVADQLRFLKDSEVLHQVMTEREK